MILYRLLMLAALPVLALMAARRDTLAERMARVPLPEGAIWVHGASNGELTSARSVIEGLAAQGDTVLVTCNNPTAKAMVSGWNLPGVTARLAPFDVWPVMRRFLRSRPRALIVVENELWPERILSAPMPVLVIGARMSERSARRWARIGLMRRMLQRLSWVSAQDEGSETRLRDLGLPADRIGPRLTLKSAIRLDDSPLPPLPHPRDTTLLAASTHPGEDEVILDAFRAQSRFRWLILAPRHPVRGDEVAALARGKGFAVAQRSAGDAPGGEVYVADTLGEMPLWYRAACATVIGGSFLPKGGHTPFEPAAYDSALIHGPHVANFAAIFASLYRDGAALSTQADTLAATLDGMDPLRRGVMVRAASAALRSDDAAAVVLTALNARVARP
ncbi:3-deoxy-D-manno-octulosonic acid transferase [Falsirhodobacter sp. 20TX0035]|uniref:3-deoxy-D-manno-octulosonic acid transferase n=1 Tax=Falsirhodobacter sp. 20TX0035 TaxID=3022019 RepID=UPI00232B9C53|nr:glycosyltransferase N-terminal domain-containing protein [Falsirhodobacter sp. 20TX0035]MDB6452048.1 glycosyltransferase N-terminal domain-containing protein [Falsirhodobacter sp. 20TX0035]